MRGNGKKICLMAMVNKYGKAHHNIKVILHKVRSTALGCTKRKENFNIEEFLQIIICKEKARCFMRTVNPMKGLGRITNIMERANINGLINLITKGIFRLG